MKTNFIIQVLEISMDRLSSTCKIFESPLDVLYLAQHYRANPKIMNTVLIPVKSVSSSTSSLSIEPPRRHYEVLANHHLFFALKKAQCRHALCLFLSGPEEQTEIWQTELQIQPGRPNITAMNQEELQQAFDYLVKEKLGKREKVLPDLLNHRELIPKLVNDSSRPYWSSWKPFEALAQTLVSNKINKTHTECLNQYFCVKPQPLSSLSINTASAEELSGHIKILLLDLDARQKVLRKLLSHRELIPKLVNDSSRPHWSSWKPFKALAQTLVSSKVDKRHTDHLDQYFCFTPESPQIPNTASSDSSK